MAYVFRQPDPELGRLIGLLARSIRCHYPGARVVLMTNEAGRASGVPAGVEVRVSALDPDPVMVERIRQYRDYVHSVSPGTVVVFMDTDMLVVRRFDELMAPDADLTVTIRNYRDMPINAGLVVVRTDDHPRMRDFFDRLHDCCASLSEDEKRWYGDQIAFGRLLDPPSVRLKRLFVAQRAGLRVRFAPSRVFNCTPRPWMLALGVYRPGVRVLHFKGDRKARMPLYAGLYLSRRFHSPADAG
jgi:hypothetical protein